MKKKQKREWCHLSDQIKLNHNYKKKYFRCACGKRVEVIAVLDLWDYVNRADKNGHYHLVPEIVFKVPSPHKTKVKYRENDQTRHNN